MVAWQPGLSNLYYISSEAYWRSVAAGRRRLEYTQKVGEATDTLLHHESE